MTARQSPLELLEPAALTAGPTYQERANRYRTTDPVRFAAEIRRMAGSGLTAHDIAGLLQLAPSEVLRLLAMGSAA